MRASTMRGDKENQQPVENKNPDTSNITTDSRDSDIKGRALFFFLGIASTVWVGLTTSAPADTIGSMNSYLRATDKAADENDLANGGMSTEEARQQCQLDIEEAKQEAMAKATADWFKVNDYVHANIGQSADIRPSDSESGVYIAEYQGSDKNGHVTKGECSLTLTGYDTIEDDGTCPKSHNQFVIITTTPSKKNIPILQEAHAQAPVFNVTNATTSSAIR